MQSVSYLKEILSQIATKEHFLFSRKDVKLFLAGKTEKDINMILSRCVKTGFLKRICNGLFLNTKVNFDHSLVLPKVAAKLRENVLNYHKYGIGSVRGRSNLTADDELACCYDCG